MPEKVHHGRAVKRIREMMHIKQDALAIELNIAQQTVSALEAKETIDPETLEQIAKVLKVPVDAIKNFNEEGQIYNIQHNYEGSTVTQSPVHASYCTFNALDKWLEALEDVKKLNAALLKEKDEKIALLERMLNEKKK
jgi:transcriptional regulator with XRE-family HTH domain